MIRGLYSINIQSIHTFDSVKETYYLRKEIECMFGDWEMK